MSLITITLTEQEQETLLSMAGWTLGDTCPESPAWDSVAAKIRRVQAAEEAFGAAYGDAACGLCDIPRDLHDAEDHGWQWLPEMRKPDTTACGRCGRGQDVHDEDPEPDHRWQWNYPRKPSGDLPG